jgi:hypothetical protein
MSSGMHGFWLPYEREQHDLPGSTSLQQRNLDEQSFMAYQPNPSKVDPSTVVGQREKFPLVITQRQSQGGSLDRSERGLGHRLNLWDPAAR